MGRDKRTEAQMNDDLAQKARPWSAQDTRTVTTGPATGVEDERVNDADEVDE